MSRLVRKSILIIAVLSVLLMTVTPWLTENTEAASRMHLKKTTVTMTIGETWQQKLYSSTGKTIKATKVTWTSNNKKIAKVTKQGKVTAIGKGTATLKAKYAGKTYRFKVYVKAATFNVKECSIYLEESQKLYLKSASGKKIASDKVNWESQNPQIAEVDELGIVQAKDIGTTDISATYQGKIYHCRCTVKGLKPPMVTGVTCDDYGRTTIYWKPGTSADGYCIYSRIKGTSEWKQVSEVKGSLSYSSSSKSGAVYYAVSAYKMIDGVKVYSEKSMGRKLKCHWD